MSDTMISDILRISRELKGLVKKNLVDMLADRGFPKDDWTVQQVWF